MAAVASKYGQSMHSGLHTFVAPPLHGAYLLSKTRIACDSNATRRAHGCVVQSLHPATRRKHAAAARCSTQGRGVQVPARRVHTWQRMHVQEKP